LPDAPDLATEILMRSGRSNKLPIGDPKADSYVPSLRIPDLRRAVAKLRPGQLVLMNRSAQQVVAALRSNPSLDPLDPLSRNKAIYGRWGIENWVLQHIDQRFELQPIYQDGQGFVVAELVPRR
jgi:hypothetical protein